MVDVADVGLVDPHPEGDRRDHDPVRRARPPLLHADALLGAHAGVVGAGGEAGLGEQLGDAHGRSLQRHVDDRRAGRTLAQPLEQQPVALAGGDRRQQQRQIRPVEAGHDRVRLLDPEPRQMSATTAGVAVAVSASTRSAPSSRARSASFR